MNEKLTLQDLVDLLAKSAGLTKKEADAFLREFLSVISDSIFSGEQVKIKDFGTFKLTSVKSRESINVNTGEKIEIPSHHKLSFIPDKALKLLVNKPFEQFETTLLEDSVTFDSIEESDEPIESPEDEDTGIDELDTVVDAVIDLPEEPVASDTMTVEEEVVSVSDERDGVDSPLSDEDEKISDADRPIHVYTYVTEPEKPEVYNGASTVVSEEQVVDEPVVEKVSSIKKASSVDLIEDEDEETGEEVPLNINKVQEKIDQLKEAIDALAKVSWEDDSSEKEGDVEVQQDLETQPDYLEEKEDADAAEVGESATEVDATEVSEREVILPHDNEDVHEDITKEISRESLDEDLLRTLEEGNNISSVSKVDTSEDLSDKEAEEEEDFDFYNYKHDTAWSKFKRRIPIILFLLIVIAFGGYHFFKLFEQKNDYQNYNTYRSLSDVDTLPNLTEADERPVSLIEEDGELVIPEGIDFSEPSQDTDSVSGKLTSDEPLKTDSLQDVIGKTISKNLHIEVLRKAAYLKSGQMSASYKDANGDVDTEIQKTKFPITEVVKPGASLKLIAKQHYGNANFWVYIYEENKKDMKSIDALSIGQKLIVPDLKKYDTDINDSEANKKAKALEGKIYSSMGRF